MSTVTTHVLDTPLGQSAVGVQVRVKHLADGAASPVVQASTDDGWVRGVRARRPASGSLSSGPRHSRVLRARQPAYLYPEVAVDRGVGRWLAVRSGLR